MVAQFDFLFECGFSRLNYLLNCR